jgi:hypothetical protein
VLDQPADGAPIVCSLSPLPTGHDVHVLCDLRPWEFRTSQSLIRARSKFFLQSWWRAKAIFDMLEAASGRRIITFELDDGDLR